MKDFDEAKEFAKSLMSKVLEKESLTCLIGVAPNEMVAKIASDFKKPYGPTVVKEEDVKGSCSRRKSERSPVLDPRLNGC